MVLLDVSRHDPVGGDRDSAAKLYDVQAPTNSFDSFLQFGIQKSQEHQNVSFLEVAEADGSSSVSSKMYFIPSIGTAFVEVQKPLNQANKEMFSSILETMEERNCKRVMACISTELPACKVIFQSLLQIGFQPARTNMAVGHGMPGYAWLSFEL
eukprot:TRINITY_DN247_c0_g1_i1.p1 TRINITY_DN247_c0_g1~~TRINITY_DN247_c0_g1_i1.p1  ORF type:complete len:154 (-),score=31.43 TRINITY_DN247_c0_g1_i1:62-523(-)